MTEFQLLGEGIQHSVSPRLWNQLFAELGEPCSYGLRDVSADGLTEALDDLLGGRVRAYNITMPYKTWASTVAEVRTSDVEMSGAANLLMMHAGAVTAANTDVEAARTLLAQRHHPSTALILGAGATARAMLTALGERTSRVLVANRAYDRAAELAARQWPTDVTAVKWEDREEAAGAVELLVNTTPCGLRNDESPLRRLSTRPGAMLYDFIYRRTMTPLQRQAAELSMPVADGLAHLGAHAWVMLPLVGMQRPRGGAMAVRAVITSVGGRAPWCWEVPSASTDSP